MLWKSNSGINKSCDCVEATLESSGYTTTVVFQICGCGGKSFWTLIPLTIPTGRLPEAPHLRPGTLPSAPECITAFGIRMSKGNLN